MSVISDKRSNFNNLYSAITGKTIQETSDSQLLNMASKLESPKDININAPTRKKKAALYSEQTPLELLQANAAKKDTTSVWDDISSAVTHPSKLLKGFGQSTFGKDTFFVLEILSRPLYTVTGALAEIQRSINAGEPFWSLADDAIYGAEQGILGDRHEGYGKVVQLQNEYQRHGKSIFNQIGDLLNPGISGPGTGNSEKEIFRTVEKDPTMRNSGVMVWRNRIMGLAGDIALDPITYLHGGTQLISKESAQQGIKVGLEETGKDAISKVVENSARNALKETSIERVSTGAVKKVDRFANYTDDVINKLQDVQDQIVYDINRGAQAGKTIGSIPNIAKTLADHTGNEFRKTLLNSIEDSIKQFAGDSAKGLDVEEQAWFKRAIKDNPYFKKAHEAYISALTEAKPKTAWGIGRIAATDAMDEEVTKVVAAMQLGLKDSTIRVPTLRLLGKNIASFPEAALRASNITRAIVDTKLGGIAAEQLHNFNKMFSYASNFPGYASLIAGKIRAGGNSEYQTFRKEIQLLSKDITKEQAKLLQLALETGEPLSNPVLEKTRLRLKAMYDEIYTRERAASVLTGKKADNYAYVYLKGRETARNDFANLRKAHIQKNGNLLGYGVEEAKAKGLNPIEDAFGNILYRKTKSMRKLNRVAFQHDLITHYGVISKYIPDWKEKGLKQVDEFLDKSKPFLKNGEHVYLDTDIHHIMNEYKKLSTVGSVESKQLLKIIDYMTNKWKAAVTKYFPSFHMRNFVSDVYMAAMDGIHLKNYYEDLKNLIKIWWKKDTVDIDMAGHTYPLRKILKSYEDNGASGGFFSREFGKDNWASRMSEHREDFGRFVHYKQAMEEEYAALIKKGVSKEKAFASAEVAATYRINKYHFDYGALTSIEQKGMRRAVPFYTYMRKAIPTLVESLYLSPRNLVYTNHLFNTINNTNALDAVDYPDYLKQSLGFLGLTGGQEPFGLTTTVLPQNVFNDAFSNPAATVNPYLQGLFEMNTKKDTFSGKPANTFGDIFRNKMKIFNIKDKWEDTSKSLTEKLAYTLGVPLVQITQEMQDKQAKRDLSDFKTQLKEVDTTYKTTGMHIYLNNKNMIVVKDLLTGKTQEFTSLEEAQKALAPYKNRVAHTNSEAP